MFSFLTHWGRVTHICVGNLTIISSDNGLSPGRRQAIIWSNAGILLNGPLGTNFSEILIGIQTFSFKKMHLKMSSAKWCPFCLGLSVLRCVFLSNPYSALTAWCKQVLTNNVSQNRFFAKGCETVIRFSLLCNHENPLHILACVYSTFRRVSARKT